jgi:hypothetical protein
MVSSAATVKATETCGTIQPGVVCPLSITYSPRDSSAVTGTISLTDNTVISPQVIAFSGQGLAGLLSPNSWSVDFGHLLVNTTGAGILLFFSNTGTAPLRITSASVNGDFLISQNSCIGTFQPNDFCNIAVKFSPKAAGIRTGTLTILSNDPLHPRAGISLKGVGDTVYAVPIVSSLGSPTAQIKNGPITVQVYGANFYPASVIEVNGQAQPTTYASGQQLQAALQSGVASGIGEVSVTVFNPTPGGGTSVAVPLTRHQVLNVNAAFLAAVPGSTTLYASVPASASTNPNTVIPINPVTGALGTPIPVGKDPGLLASSSNGSYLFVVLNQDQTVQRINLATKTVDRTFPFPPNSTTCCGALSGTDLKGIPGTPEEVVLALDIPGYGFGEMALYNDRGLVNYVPTSSPATLSFSSFAYAGNPLTVYSLPFTNAQNPFFNIVAINANGLQFTPYQGGNYGGNNTTGAQVVSDGTLLYTSAGEVWNPATKTQVGSFPVTTYNATSYPNLHTLLMENATGHIFVLGDQPYGLDSASIVLSAYGQKSHELFGALAFPQVTEPLVFSLVRWGTNGFAFLSQQSPPGALVLNTFTSRVATSVSSNPLPALRLLTPSSVPQGSLGFQLTINGSGFTGSSVVKWNGAALPTTYVASTVLTALVSDSEVANSGTASVTVISPAPGGGTSNALSLTVAPLRPLISFSSSKITFPTQTVGTSTTRSVAVQNPGTAPLLISAVTIGGLNATSFHQTNNCGTSLPPGANCTIRVAFKPTSVGTLVGFVSFTDNATASPQEVTLAGTGQ